MGDAGAVAQFKLNIAVEALDGAVVTLPVNVPPLIGIPGTGPGPGWGCAQAALQRIKKQRMVLMSIFASRLIVDD